MKDRYGRDINYLRISLTENCNLKGSLSNSVGKKIK